MPRPTAATQTRFTPAGFRSALLGWYDGNRRELPWRATRDPYRVWISEVMLQQTTVRTVEPRWRRFLEKYPDVEALARAPLDDVVAEWSGLGYYTRARNLHAAARRIVEDFSGRVPATFEELLSLPGMGTYTAAAVASIGFGAPVAVLDANVERVIARLDAFATEIRSPAAKRHLSARAQELLEPARPGDWNQAMMELGALVCLPRAPQCAACPVAAFCAGRVGGTPEDFPVKRPKPPMEEVREVAVVLRREARVLILQRPAQGSFAGMWETPRGRVDEAEPVRDAVVRIAREQTGLECTTGAPLLRLRHVVMRTKIDLHVWSARQDGGRIKRASHAAHEWTLPAEWLERPISTTQKEIARFLLDGRIPRRAAPVEESPGQPDLFDGE
ncbi:MAG: A/G-specific adenine glycosylase [Candidatus Sumerlaeota bacterium]|nr:A/G-specific adenine glycosylase [Candidatus Sumerlaeota bacterium]